MTENSSDDEIDISFFTDWLLPLHDQPIYVLSLPNVRGETEAGERHVLTREPDKIVSFCKRHDRDGRGVFMCTSPIRRKSRRTRDSVGALTCLFVDVDFKDLATPPDECESILLGLELPPNRVHRSGNGMHAYWFFSDPIQDPSADDVAEVEAMLQALGNYLSGDKATRHVATVLRVPGSHNTKNGNWTPVRVVRSEGDRYPRAELARWLGSLADPVIHRRPRAVQAAEYDNPFLRAAAELGVSTPLNWRQRLEDMTVGGVDGDEDSSVHVTERQVVASMLSQGYDEGTVVQTVFEAVARIAPSFWNMETERRKIIGLARGWIRKHGDEFPDEAPEAEEEGGGDEDGGTESEGTIEEEVEDEAFAPPPTSRLSDSAGMRRLAKESTPSKGNSTPRGTAPARVVDLQRERERRKGQSDGDGSEGRKKKKKVKNDVHVALAAGVLLSLEERGESLMYIETAPWHYRDGLWRMLTTDVEKFWLATEIGRGCELLEVVPNTRVVNETIAQIRRSPDIQRRSDDVQFDQHGRISTRSGLLDWRTMELAPPDPSQMVTTRIQCEYDPTARAPTWMRMLEDLRLPEQARAFLQEHLGVALILKKQKSLMRALVLVGPSNSGKSNILSVMSSLLTDNPIATTLDRISGPHGTADFVRNDPWVLHEAFDQSRWEASATVKALLSADPIHVNPKGMRDFSHVWRGTALWGANVAPQFREMSQAIENRLAILPVRTVFDPHNPTGTAREALDRGHSSPADWVVAEELPGVLNWALEGLRRAMARGYFEYSQDMVRASVDLRHESNPAVGFFQECVDFDPDVMVPNPDLHAAFANWRRENYGGQPVSAQAFGRGIQLLHDDRITTGNRYNQRRVVTGIKLNETGLSYWQAEQTASMARGTADRLSSTEAEVNAEIPESMLTGDGREPIRRT